jgi:Pyruvate/2-oxoacid:ferredoxin oxidoreductase gamma subunit
MVIINGRDYKMGLFSKKKKVDFTNKTDVQIIEIYNELSRKQKEEVLEFLRRNVALIQTVAKVKNIPLNQFNIAKERENYYPAMFYGLSTYTELKHVYDVISKQ